MKAFLEHLVKHLVSNPQDVRIEQISGEHSIVLELHVQASDMGKVIGRKGQMAEALRTIIAAASAKQKMKYYMEIVESTNHEKESLNPGFSATQFKD